MIILSTETLLLLGFIVNIPIGLIAYRKEALTIPGGFISAGIIGYTLFITHPILWIMLALFFGSSTVLTKFKEQSETKIQALKYAEKGGKRDYFQVFANGGTGFIGSILIIFSYGINYSGFESKLFIFVCISFAAANSDTWATEIGTTSESEPVWILNPRRMVPRGTSGGVSLKGTFGSFLGSFVIGLFYLISCYFFGNKNIGVYIIPMIRITLMGFAGSLVDTLLGATIQASFICPSCSKTTEKVNHIHDVVVKTKHKSGLVFMNNDLVNFISVLIASSLIFLF